MTTDGIADLFRITPHRIFCLVLAIPAFWLMWMVVDRDPAKAVGLALALLWLAFIGRTWTWYSRPRRKTSEISGTRSSGLH